MAWRDSIRVHPAADMFPLLGAAELRELGEDIKCNGLTSTIAITIDQDGKPVLLDGRNRLSAMERIGWRLKFIKSRREGWELSIEGHLDEEHPGGYSLETIKYGNAVEEISESVDPVEYITSANIRRRHLTIEQKDEVIAKLLKADPTTSNRRIAKAVGVSHPHVASERAKLEKSGDVETVTTSVDTKGRKQPANRKTTSEPRATYEDGRPVPKEVTDAIRDGAIKLATPCGTPVDFGATTTELADAAWTHLYGTARALIEWATPENIALAMKGFIERADDQCDNVVAVMEFATVASTIQHYMYEASEAQDHADQTQEINAPSTAPTAAVAIEPGVPGGLWCWETIGKNENPNYEALTGEHTSYFVSPSYGDGPNYEFQGWRARFYNDEKYPRVEVELGDKLETAEAAKALAEKHAGRKIATPHPAPPIATRTEATTSEAA